MLRRLTAAVLALIMLVTALPAVVTAADDNAYDFGQVLWVKGKKKSGTSEYTPVTPTEQTVENGEWTLELVDGVPMSREGCKYSAYMSDDDLVYRHSHSSGCRSSESPEIVCGLPEHTNAQHAQQCYLKPVEFRWYVKNTKAPESGDGEDDEQKQYPSGTEDPEGEINLVISSIDNYGDPVKGAIYVLSEYAETTVTDASGNKTTRKELRFVGNPAIVDEFQAQAAAASQEKLDRIDELNAIGDPNGEVAALIAELNADSQNNAAQLQTLQWQMTPRQTGEDGKVYFRSLEKYLDESTAVKDDAGNAVWTWYLSQDGSAFTWGMPLYDTHSPNTDIWTVTITRYAAGGYHLDVQTDGKEGYSGDPANGAITVVNESLKCKLVVGFDCLDAQTGETLMGQYVKNANGYLALVNEEPQKILNVLAVVRVEGPDDYSELLTFSENSGTWQKELTNLEPGTYTMTLLDRSMSANGYTWNGEIRQTLKVGNNEETGSDVTSVELGQNSKVATYTYTAEFTAEENNAGSGNCQLIVEFESLDQESGNSLVGQTLKDDKGKEVLDAQGNPQKILSGYARVEIEGPDGYLKELWFAEDSGWKIPVTGLAPGQYTVRLQSKSMAAKGYTWAGEVVQRMTVGGETTETDTVSLDQTANTATCVFVAEYYPTGYQPPVGKGDGKLTIRFDCIDQTTNTSLVGQKQKDADGKEIEDKLVLDGASAQILVTGPDDYSQVLNFPENGKWEKQLTGLNSGSYEITLVKRSLKAAGYSLTGEIKQKLEIGGQTQTGSGVTSVTLDQNNTEAAYTYTASFKPGEGSSSGDVTDNTKAQLVVNFECVENVVDSSTGLTNKNLLMGRYQQNADGSTVVDENGNYKKLLDVQATVTVTGPDGYKKSITFSETGNKWKETLTGLQAGDYTITLSKDSRMRAEGYNWVKTIRTLVAGGETTTGDNVTKVTLGKDCKSATYTYTAEFEKSNTQQNQSNKNNSSNYDPVEEEEIKKLLGEIVVKAVDDRGYKLTGATFELHGKRENPVPLEVDKHGIIQEDWGAYAEEGKQLSWVIKQSNEIEGYEKTTDEFSVQITMLNGQPQFEIVCIQEGNLFERLLKSEKIKEGPDGETILYFKNPRKKAQVNVSYDLKVDVDSKCRDAAETKKAFQAMKHKFILSWKDDNGKSQQEIMELEAGKAATSESKLPFGKEYTLTVADSETFNCKINGETSDVLKEKVSTENVKNGKITVKASIEYDIDRGPDQDLYLTKVSKVARKPLKGASFVLKDTNGKDLKEYTTQEDGAVEIEGLLTQVGTYQLKETKAPLACLRLRKPIEIKIEVGYTPVEIKDKIVLQQGLKATIDNKAVELQSDGTYHILTTKLGENPKTGDSSNIFLWAGVMALSAVGLTAVLIRKTGKKRKNRRSKEQAE